MSDSPRRGRLVLLSGVGCILCPKDDKPAQRRQFQRTLEDVATGESRMDDETVGKQAANYKSPSDRTMNLTYRKHVKPPERSSQPPQRPGTTRCPGHTSRGNRGTSGVRNGHRRRRPPPLFPRQPPTSLTPHPPSTPAVFRSSLTLSPLVQSISQTMQSLFLSYCCYFRPPPSAVT